jgi:hypothetical protein
MYTTREMEALPGEEGDVVTAFNAEVQNRADYQAILGYMSTQQNMPLTSLNFTTVPVDAPELRDVLRDFARMLEEDENELHNAWGAIIITQAQNNLKRIDVLIVWDEVQIERGRPVMNANGEPVLVLDENGQPVPGRNSQHVYIHRDSQYFAAPGA